MGNETERERERDQAIKKKKKIPFYQLGSEPTLFHEDLNLESLACSFQLHRKG